MSLDLPTPHGALTDHSVLPADPAQQAVIELRNVSKTYGDHHAVADLSMTIRAGEWVTLLGPSGCGKTTTLRMVAGFIAPDTGTILLQGRDVTRVPPERRGLGIVFQNYALFPHMSVADNIAFGLRRRKLPRQKVRQRISEALDLVQLRGFDKRKPGQLSGGQQQRVALARAIAIQPSALLLDEPLSNLDAALRDEMRVELRQLQRRLAITTLFVTHDQEEALALSDRVAVMNSGRCVQMGSPWDVYERPTDEFTARFLRFRNILTGRGITRGEGWIDVELLSGLIVRARSVPTPAQRDTVTIAIRPERVRLVENSVLSGQVKDVTYLGEQVRCLVDTQVGIVTIAAQAALAPRASSRVGIEFPPLAAQEVI